MSLIVKNYKLLVNTNFNYNLVKGKIHKKLFSRMPVRAAHFVSKLLYWMDAKHNKNIIENKRWVFNSYNQWINKAYIPYMCERSFRYMVKFLRDKEIIITKQLHINPTNRTNFYHVNVEKLMEFLGITLEEQDCSYSIHNPESQSACHSAIVARSIIQNTTVNNKKRKNIIKKKKRSVDKYGLNGVAPLTPDFSPQISVQKTAEKVAGASSLGSLLQGFVK